MTTEEKKTRITRKHKFLHIPCNPLKFVLLMLTTILRAGKHLKETGCKGGRTQLHRNKAKFRKKVKHFKE